MDESFIRRGADLFVDMSVNVYKLLAGGFIEVPTPEGTLVHEIKPTKGSATSIVIPGCGMPFYDNDKKGNLIVKLHAIFPQSTTAEEDELIKKLSAYAK